MNSLKENQKPTQEQLNGAEKLCQVIASVPSGKRQMFEAVVLAYMNGMEAGIAYCKDMTLSAMATR